MKIKTPTFTILLFSILLFEASLFVQVRNKDEIVYEVDNQVDSVDRPRIQAISEKFIVWMLFEVTIYDIETGEVSILKPTPCQSWRPETGDIASHWLTVHSVCSDPETFEISRHSYLYDLRTNTFTNLTELSPFTNLLESYFGQTDGENVLWVQRDYQNTYPHFNQSIVHIYNLATEEIITYPNLGDGRVLKADIDSPWVIVQAHETDSPNSDIITYTYNIETDEQYEINRHFYQDFTIIKEHHIVWSDYVTNDIYHHNLLTSDTKMVVSNQFEYQIAMDISRSLIYFTADPIPSLTTVSEEVSLGNNRLFGHTRVYSYNINTEEIKLIYDNPNAKSMGPALSFGDHLTWGEEVRPTPSHRISRVYYRNITPFKQYIPLIETQ